MEKLGIENIQTILFFAAGLAKDFDKALKDGKFQWTEATFFLDDLTKIPKVANAALKLPAEFLDLTIEEQEQIKNNFADRFDITHEKAEKAVEETLDLAISIFRYAMKMNAIFRKK